MDPTVTRMGGGVYIHGSNPVIVSNIIKNNGSEYSGRPNGGGGIAILDQSKPYILNNIIVGNFGELGGGIYSEDSEGVINGNIISTNNSHENGGGFSIYNSSHIIEHNLIIHNSCHSAMRGWGGGIYILSAAPSLIRNNTFYDNWANNWGGGVYVEIGAKRAKWHCSIMGRCNSALQ
jgi:hypothetical protein